MSGSFADILGSFAWSTYIIARSWGGVWAAASFDAKSAYVAAAGGGVGSATPCPPC